MNQIIHSVAQHGYLLLFAWVLAEQLGLPVPAAPVLLAAGVLSGMNKLSFGVCVAIALLACTLGDWVWFLLGRRYGTKMVNQLCRMSLEPDTCVRKTSNVFDKHGPAALLLAKFMPGIGTVSIPMAGNSAMNIQTFALYDFAGCGLYVLTLIGAGLLFTGSVEKVRALTVHAGSLGVAVVIAAAVGLVGRRVRERRRFRRDLTMSRIVPSDLLAMLQTGKNPYVVDLRHPLDFLPYPQLIPTAVRITPENLLKQAAEIPRDRDIILYCT